MAKFCRSCGAPLEEGAEKCGSCGADLTAPAAPAAQPQTNEKVNEILDKVSDVLSTSFLVVEKILRIAAKKVVKIVRNAQQKNAENAANPAEPQKETSLNVVRLAIAVVMIVLCLIAIIMNVTMKYDVTVTATAKYDGETMSESASGPMDELLMEDEFIPLGIVCLAWVAFNLVLVIMAVILIIKLVKLANTNRSYQSLAMTGLIGDVVYMILYKVFGVVTMDSWGMTVKYSVGFHSIVWIHVVLFALAVAWTYVSKMLNAAPSMAQISGESASE